MGKLESYFAKGSYGKRRRNLKGEEWLKRAQALSGGLMNDDALAFYERKENWHLLPRTDYLYFPDTVFRGADGNLSVRVLDWFGERWYRDYDWLHSHWDGRRPSVSLASPQSSEVSPRDLISSVLCPSCGAKLEVQMEKINEATK